MTPGQFKSSVDQLEKAGELGHVTTSLSWNSDLFRNYYEQGKSTGSIKAYKNYNLDQQDTGMWWHGVVNPNRQDAPGIYDCEELIFWAQKDKAPGVANAITSEVLAKYAYDSIRVPDTEVTLNPTTTQTVNLPTWAWLDKARFAPVRVTAELPGTGLRATTTATPVALHIDAGTPDASVFPSGGDCPIDTGGRIGTPYVTGAKGDPPCGVTYRRMTNGRPFPLRATVTWKISWTGTGHDKPTRFPDGTFAGKPVDLIVREVQAINR